MTKGFSVNTTRAKRVFVAAGVAAWVIGLSGCATTANNPKDPYEGFNRAMFTVNEGLDTVLLKPVAKGYDTVTPGPVKSGVGNFFGNLADVWTALNNFLQGKVSEGFSDVGRVFVNSTIGLVGLFDVASNLGMEKHAEDFGQTLGKWGVGSGSYVYLPVIGPRTTRDTVGFVVDAYADPVARIDNVRVRNSLLGLRLIDTRASLLPADKVVEEAAFDKYVYIRDAYLQNRRSVVYDGAPPAEKDEGQE